MLAGPTSTGTHAFEVELRDGDRTIAKVVEAVTGRRCPRSQRFEGPCLWCPRLRQHRDIGGPPRDTPSC